MASKLPLYFPPTRLLLLPVLEMKTRKTHFSPQFMHTFVMHSTLCVCTVYTVPRNKRHLNVTWWRIERTFFFWVWLCTECAVWGRKSNNCSTVEREMAICRARWPLTKKRERKTKQMQLWCNLRIRKCISTRLKAMSTVLLPEIVA